MHSVNFPELRGTRSVHREVKWPARGALGQPRVLSSTLCLLPLWSMCDQQHTQSHILPVKFHEVHFEDQIPTPVLAINTDHLFCTFKYKAIKLCWTLAV